MNLRKLPRPDLAIERYETTSGRVAEIAVAVAPAWRRIGLASTLVHMLGRTAVDRGFDRFTAVHSADNCPVAELLNDARGRR